MFVLSLLIVGATPSLLSVPKDLRYAALTDSVASEEGANWLPAYGSEIAIAESRADGAVKCAGDVFADHGGANRSPVDGPAL